MGIMVAPFTEYPIGVSGSFDNRLRLSLVR